MHGPRPLAFPALTVVASLFVAASLAARPVGHVLHISVDGLRADALTTMPAEELPNFHRLLQEGASTLNARCDFDISVTLPNHTTQLTGRGILGPRGHNWSENKDPLPHATLASNKGSYIAGAFDVAHDCGLRTAAYVSKSKFALLDTSWDAVHGAADTTGEDNGRDKIDRFVCDGDTMALVQQLAADLRDAPAAYTFLHLTDPDGVGHASGWDLSPSSAYRGALARADAELGVLLRTIDESPTLAGHTAIVLTADHGGTDMNHGDPTLATNYTVPFVVWGPGVEAGADLYTLNPTTRHDPGTGRPDYDTQPQPIRNGEAGNESLKLLGLGPIPGSTIGAAQDLAVGR